MGKAVKHFHIFTQFLYRQTVIFLIQEKSSLLSVFDIHQIAHSVFRDLYFGIKRRSDKAFDALQSFTASDLRIAPFIDAPYLYTVFEKLFF